MNLQTPIRDRARGLRGPGLTSEQESQVEEAIALGAAIPNITATSGEKLAETSALSAVNGGATLISVGGRAVGWTIPAGQTGAGTNVIARIPFSYDEAARLKGSTIRIRVVSTVTAGYLAATPFGGNAVRVDRKDGTTENNAGEALTAVLTGTRLVRDFLYTMVGDERFVGGTMQVGSNSPTAAARSLQITSVTWDVVATPATAGATGADAALEARVAALRPAANMLDKIEPVFQLFNGAQALLDASGRTVGVVIAAASTGMNTILQWRAPMQGRLRKMMPGRQIKLTLGFDTPENWSRAHTLNMQVRKSDLTTTNIVTSSVVDEQISPTRRVMSFTCLIPTGVILDDLRPFIVMTDATVAGADETIELTDFTVDYAQNNNDVMQEAASTTLLGDEFTRSASVDQAVGTIDGTGKRIGALLRSTSFAGIAAALISATNLAAPGAAAAVTVPAGIHVATSLGVIGSGTDGDNVILRGEGMGRSIIDGRLPANTPVATIQATSPVDFNASQEVSDLTIWGKNCRYGWHIDAVKFKPNSRLIARNVEVIHYGNDEANAYWGSTTWASPHGVAIGTCSGSVYRFEGGRKIGPRAAFSAHDQVDFTSPSRIEIINETLTATWDAYWSLRLESIGSMMINQCLVQGSTHSGEISMAVTPWLPTALDQQPADHRCWEIFGSGNSPTVFRIEDFGRALRITSATTGTASKVVISNNAAPILFGKTGTEGVTQVNGDVGLSGCAYGWADISDTSPKAAITALKFRLGNRTASPVTLTVQVDALAPIDIILNKNYLVMTNAEIIADLNAALGGVAIVSEYAVGQRYRPSFADEEKSLQNTSGTTILMGMALAVDSNGARTVRPMLSTDLPTAFAGVAWEDIRPGAYGRVKTGGWLPTTDLLRSDGGSPNPGTTFTIDPAKPGYALSNNASGSGILPVIRGSLGAGLWTVAVRTQMDGQDVVDQAAGLVQEANDAIAAVSDIADRGAAAMPFDQAASQDAGSIGAYLNLHTMFRNRSLAQSVLIPGTVDQIDVLNFDTNEIEDSRAVYRRVGAEPAHAGKIQTAGGQWWEIADSVLRPEMFGAFGFDDPAKIVEDTYGLQNSLDVSAALLRQIDGKVATYIIDTYKGARPAWTNGGRWTHGGIIFPAGAKFVGAGRGRTIFKNGSALGRCLARWRDSGLHHIEGCTFDYDFPNKDSVPYASPATSTTGQGGTGILFEGGGTTVMDLLIRDVEVKNTAGYGLGIENVTIASALIDNLTIDKPGADAIDIKSWPLAANGGPKVGIMTNIFVPNGCGHNYIATGEEGGHDDQACIDIGGAWHVSNVQIDKLTCDPASTGNTGIRFRSATVGDGREGAPRSTLTGFRISSTKAEGAGSDTDNNIIGLAVYSPDVTVSNGHIENCRHNLLIGSYGAAENPDPMDVSLTNVTCINANDATGTGANFKVTAAVRDITALGVKIRGGDIGAHMDGSGGALDLNIEDCALGIKATKNIWRNYNWVGLRLAGNIVDSDTMPDIGQNSMVANKSIGLLADRQAWLNIEALADDAGWSGEDAYPGGVKFFTHDASAAGRVEIGRIAAQALGSSGSTYQLTVRMGNVAFNVRSTGFMFSRSVVGNYADDTAAAAAGVPLDGLYRTGSTLKLRVA